MEKHGLKAAEDEYRLKFAPPARNPILVAPSYAKVVRGKLDFIRMVRGESDQTYRRLWNKLHAIDPRYARDELEIKLSDPPSDATWEYWFARYKDFVYQVESRKDGQTRGGTAFLWTDRSLATCSHCLDGEATISPPLPESQPVRDAEYHDDLAAGVDVALIRLSDAASTVRHPFPIRSEPLQPGEQVAALGFPAVPGVLPQCMIRPGFVEASSKDYRGKIERIIVSPDISGGFSGGPVIDRGGNLVAIVVEKSWELTAANVPAAGFRHVLPARYIAEIYRRSRR